MTNFAVKEGKLRMKAENMSEFTLPLTIVHARTVDDVTAAMIEKRLQYALCCRCMPSHFVRGA